jgi:hypothetical protein
LSATSPLKITYRVVRWAILAALIVALILMLRKAPAPDVPYDPTATARVRQELATADQAEASGEPSQVHLDRVEVNSYLHDNLQLEGSPQSSAGTTLDANNSQSANDPPRDSNAAPPVAATDPQTVEQVQSSVKDVQINMEGDLITAYVVFDFHGEDLSLELDGHLCTENGYLQFDPVSGKLGSLPLPQATLDSAVRKLMDSPENREKLKLPDGISDVQVVDGHVVVTYR